MWSISGHKTASVFHRYDDIIDEADLTEEAAALDRKRAEQQEKDLAQLRHNSTSRNVPAPNAPEQNAKIQ
jgi:hypothetical protein